MKIVVDKLPKKPEECLFSSFLGGDNKYTCRINGNLCKLMKSDRCCMLKGFDHVHMRNFIV